VAVEKLICGKRAQIASRQDALQTIFSGRQAFPIPDNHAVFVDIDFFNTHSQYGVTGADALIVG
jgi:hypothetical protein